MLIYAVDDEPLSLKSLARAIREAEHGCLVREFTWGQPVLEAICGEGERPDVVFMDVEMPGLNGIEVARRIKLISPHTWLVFVTGFSEYALDAYAIHAKGYVMKPVTAQAIRAELDAPAPPPLCGASGPRVRVKTFGNFDVLVDGKPLEFTRSKAKEMLAYLVHRRGAACTTQELAAVLFEDRVGGKLDYFFKVAQCLKRTLSAAGCGDILRHSYKSYAVIPSMIDCDYYDFISDTSAEALNAYAGEYMAQYSWAELTSAYLNDKCDIADMYTRACRPSSEGTDG